MIIVVLVVRGSNENCTKKVVSSACPSIHRQRWWNDAIHAFHNSTFKNKFYHGLSKVICYCFLFALVLSEAPSQPFFKCHATLKGTILSHLEERLRRRQVCSVIGLENRDKFPSYFFTIPGTDTD